LLKSLVKLNVIASNTNHHLNNQLDVKILHLENSNEILYEYDTYKFFKHKLFSYYCVIHLKYFYK